VIADAAKAGFILEQQPQPSAGGQPAQRLRDDGGKFFLNFCCSS
jgi:hypothetical protein